MKSLLLSSIRNSGRTNASVEKILSMDRQTSVAVDIAEQTAAKTALQNAALDLAERLVPTLVK